MLIIKRRRGKKKEKEKGRFHADRWCFVAAMADDPASISRMVLKKRRREEKKRESFASPPYSYPLH